VSRHDEEIAADLGDGDELFPALPGPRDYPDELMSQEQYFRELDTIYPDALADILPEALDEIENIRGPE
jgi:hypothetical protein